MQALVLALVSFPEVTRKAQEEIDHVVGSHRLPTMEDFEHLPYIRAIVQEALSRPLPSIFSADAVPTRLTAGDPLLLLCCLMQASQKRKFVSMAFSRAVC
jgi:hypothetical protein